MSFDHGILIILWSSYSMQMEGIKRALEVPVDIAKEYGAANSHQNGWVITTTQKFLNAKRSKDITVPLSVYNK